jgi:hypothetical protein
MHLKHIWITGLALILLSDVAFSQGTILMLNGKEKRYMNYQVQDEYVVFQPEAKPDSWKKRVDRFNVFSITPDNGAEVVLYNPDTTDGLEPSVPEVRDFIAGEKLAMEEYRKPLNIISGVGVGLGSSMAAFYGIPGPVIYSSILGRVSPKLPQERRDEVHSEAFVAGYQKKARTMKINRSLLGGGIGFSIGIATLLILAAD